MKTPDPRPITMQPLRDKLAGRTGRRYWRGLEELAATPEFRERLEKEFPALASEFNDPVGRRRFLQVMGASMALAGITACTRQPKETISPYTEAPESVIPGKPLMYATAVTLGGVATGVLVETHEGRPTRIEGNPDHPASLGAADVFTQAAILGLYDPDRSRTVNNLGEIRAWGDFPGILRDVMKAQEPRNGAGLRILTETVTSPTLEAQIRELLAKYPEARWHQYEPVTRDNVHEGARLAFREEVDSIYQLQDADVILSLDADLLSPGPGALPMIRQFAARRRPKPDEAAGMNRLYVAECAPSATGAMADHRLPMRASDIEALAREVARQTGVRAFGRGSGEAGSVGAAPAALPDKARRWVEAVAKDLLTHRGRSLVIAGPCQPPAVHAIAHAMNESLANTGRTVVQVTAARTETAPQLESLRRLTDDMQAGRVDLLMILGGNPVYTAPADVPFASAMQKVALRVHLADYEDETSALCQWHIPRTHELETWSDTRAHDGTVTIQQPMIEPLYGGRSDHEILAVLMDRTGKSSYDLVRDHWKTKASAGLSGPVEPGFEGWWRKCLHDGLVQGTASPIRRASLRTDWASAVAAASPSAPAGDSLEINFKPDPAVFDGRFANNGWLQELPRPITRLAWDNAALIAPTDAERLGLENGDVVTLRLDGRSVDAPIWIAPGHARGSVTVHMGYGRRRSGRVGQNVGFDASALRASKSPWFAYGLTLEKTGRRHELACTQTHQSMEGRRHVRAGTGAEYAADPEFVHHMGEEPAANLSLYPPFAYEGHAWGMSIDLSSCVGCNACVIGCQSENNIPVVGKDQVLLGREMHWIRVDRYFEGDLDAPEFFNQPVPCMHCENAPCEPVCPVGATVHSSEGLNDMVYNRCVGTRYCSNNCPYKVRRFNFMLYQDWKTPSLKMLRNPDVSVRSRGVMEKCTYCVQRINQARITSQREDRTIRDGEILTACQQACPAQAIVFGDINDPESAVSKRKAEPRSYGLLAELGTRPRTTYLAALRNPNPELEKD